jgi:uroporphyrinogen-III synthase
VRIAAIGPGTADKLAKRHLVADLVPERAIAESLLEAFPLPHSGEGHRALLARAEVAREILPEGLRAMGWDVDVVDAYRTIAAAPTAEQRAEVESCDIVTFTSASTVDQWVAAFGADCVPATVACIGPVTADAARRAGFTVAVVAKVHTIDGLVDALVDHFAQRPEPKPGTAPKPKRAGARRGAGRRGHA